MTDQEMLTQKEVADMLRVSVSTLQRRAKDLPSLRVGRTVRYRRADVLAWVEACTERKKSPARRRDRGRKSKLEKAIAASPVAAAILKEFDDHAA